MGGVVEESAKIYRINTIDFGYFRGGLLVPKIDKPTHQDRLLTPRGWPFLGRIV
uniref:hypothetical protein n=1 Tax=Nocardia sp. CA-095871 TaxID=3239971 RepID=UPI003F4988EA